MKVLTLSWEFPPHVAGGLGRHVAELSPALANAETEVHILVPVNKPVEPILQLQPNLTVHWVDASSVSLQLDIYNRAKQVNDLLVTTANSIWSQVGGFDIIHAHDWLVSFAAIKLKLSHKIPLVATIHATEQGRWRNHVLPDELSRKIDKAEKDLSFEAWRVIACSHYMVKELCRQFLLPENKLDMIPNGIEIDHKRTYSPQELAEFRARFAQPYQPLIFSVGRLVYEKGYQVLIQGLSQIMATGANIKVVLAGKGPMLSFLQEQSQKYNLNNRIQFAGFISNEERDLLLYTADCAIFPSLYEPFGIVALEAMAHNCPVIVSQVGGFAEVVTHNQTGTLIYPDNPHSVAWGLLQVLNNPVQTANHAAAAYRMVNEKYNWPLLAHKTRQVYQRVLKERAETDW